jgi:hypothetical protein
MIKVTVNKGKANSKIRAQEEEVVLAEIILAAHTIGDCLHNFHIEHNLSDKVFEFTKKMALLAFVDGCNGTDPGERYTRDGN